MDGGGLSALAPPFAGWIHDITGSYRLLFLCFLALLFLVMVASTRLRVPATALEKFGANKTARQMV